MTSNTLRQNQIRSCLQNPPQPTHDLEGEPGLHSYRPASVLIPMLQHEAQWHILFIRRADNELDYHSGQVAFAGGKAEAEDDNSLQTAVREAEEEIGLNPQHVSILGQLNPHYSISRFQITPVVAEIPWPYEFTLDKQEVAHVFTIPLEWLADPVNRRVELRTLNNADTHPVTYFNEYQGEVLWGATARMTISLLTCLGFH